jgi:hypothetical protein
LVAKQHCRVGMQDAPHRASDRKGSREQQRERNASKYEGILRGGLADNPRKQAACGHPKQEADNRTARKQDEHAAERGRKNLLGLRTERDANTQLAQPLADRIGGQAEGAGDREEESKSAEAAEGTSAVLVFATCETGKNAAGCGSSPSVKYFPSATTPTIWTDTPSRFLK